MSTPSSSTRLVDAFNSPPLARMQLAAMRCSTALPFRADAVCLEGSDAMTCRLCSGVVHAAAEPVVAEAAHLVHDREERLTLRRQRVLDPRRRLRVAVADDDALGLEPAQALGQSPR